MKTKPKTKPKTPKQDIVIPKVTKLPDQPPAPKTQLQVIDSKTALALRQDFSQEQITLMKDTIARGTTDVEFAWFLYVAKARRLDPLQRQIHCVKRKVYNKDRGEYDEVMTIQVGIDGLRSIANRTNLYMPSPHQPIVDKTDKGVLIGVTVFVLKWSPHDKQYHEFSGTARFNEYMQVYREGNELKPAGRWAIAPVDQCEKCAEAKALRRGWPEELGDFYAPEELDHVVNVNPAPPKGKGEVTTPKETPKKTPEKTPEPPVEMHGGSRGANKAAAQEAIKQSEEPNRGHGNEGTQHDQRKVTEPSRDDLLKMLDDTIKTLWPDAVGQRAYRAIAGKTLFGVEVKNELRKLDIKDLMRGVLALKIFQAEIVKSKQMPLTTEALDSQLFNCLTAAKEKLAAEWEEPK